MRALIERLPLRARFLVAPLLGLALLALLSGAFLLESRRQGDLLERLAGDDISHLRFYFQVFATVSEQHVALYELLSRARELSEEQVYEQAQPRLEALHAATDMLQRAADRMGSSAASGVAPLARSVAHRVRHYRQAVGGAAEISTLDLGEGAKRLVAAGPPFSALNRAFLDLIEGQQALLAADIAGQVERTRDRGVAFAVAGVGLAILLLALSLVLAQYLSRRLERQLAVLTSMVGAGEKVEISGANEVEKIETAIAAFRDLHARLGESRRALEASNVDLERRVASRTLELSEANASLRLYAQALRSTREAIVLLDGERRVIEANLAYERMCGVPRSELCGAALRLGGVDDGAAAAELWRAVAAEGHWTGEVLHARPDGDEFPAWMTVNAVRSEEGRREHFVAVLRDITDLKQGERRLKQLAFFDSLTGLPNRALFLDRLETAVQQQQRGGGGLALLYVDLDGFKYVNDTLGHAAGDRLLAEMAQRLLACVRAADTVARVGGDEFGVIVAESNDEAVRGVARRIVDAVRVPAAIDAETVRLGASVGISFYGADAADAEELQLHADAAMYEAKQAGRDQFRMFRPRERPSAASAARPTRTSPA